MGFNNILLMSWNLKFILRGDIDDFILILFVTEYYKLRHSASQRRVDEGLLVWRYKVLRRQLIKIRCEFGRWFIFNILIKWLLFWGFVIFQHLLKPLTRALPFCLIPIFYNFSLGLPHMLWGGISHECRLIHTNNQTILLQIMRKQATNPLTLLIKLSRFITQSRTKKSAILEPTLFFHYFAGCRIRGHTLHSNWFQFNVNLSSCNVLKTKASDDVLDCNY